MAELRVGERRERFGQRSLLHVVVEHDEALEQRRVPLAAEVRRRAAVRAGAAGEQVKRLCERRLDVADRGARELDVLLGLGGLGAEPLLLARTG